MPSLVKTPSALISAALWLALPAAAANPEPWPAILASVGLAHTQANVVVLQANAPGNSEWPQRVDKGLFLILEGESPAAEMFGFRPTGTNVRVASLTDVHQPKLPIIWQSSQDLPKFEVPASARVFAQERWTGAPLVAGFRRGKGAVLWVALSPGEKGYERFPYIPNALADLGLEPPFRTNRLWAFFDDSYRSRVDPDYFAERWRASGIAALHVAAWHFFEPNPQRDQYLTELIRAAHQRAILIYAWLELPHVSDQFWNDHPQWREQTALQQDAQLDWRKLMNLANPDCHRAVAKGVQDLLNRFDWDGVNLAELYYESLEGAANPARFTPMNPDIREQFRQAQGFDPRELFQRRMDPASLKKFLDFRAAQARQMQSDWIAEVEKSRARHPDLDIVLTQVDDRLDTSMRDAIGADTAGVLPLLNHHSMTFLIEDPATVWNQGPGRYQELAKSYGKLTTQTGRLALDINVADRYQDVYPTKRQTGTELYQLVHQAAASFPRVALYVENSIPVPDWKLLPAAAAQVTRYEKSGGKLVVESAQGTGIAWSGRAQVDGAPWPVADGQTVWLAPGRHEIEATTRSPALEIRDFNGDLKSATADAIVYQSDSRAIAVMEQVPALLEIDGVPAKPVQLGPKTIALPRGQHLVTMPAGGNRSLRAAAR